MIDEIVGFYSYRSMGITFLRCVLYDGYPAYLGKKIISELIEYEPSELKKRFNELTPVHIYGMARAYEIFKFKKYAPVEIRRRLKKQFKQVTYLDLLEGIDSFKPFLDGLLHRFPCFTKIYQQSPTISNKSSHLKPYIYIYDVDTELFSIYRTFYSSRYERSEKNFLIDERKISEYKNMTENQLKAFMIDIQNEGCLINNELLGVRGEEECITIPE